MELEKICRDAITKYPDAVNKYHAGKTALIGLFTGEVMKQTRGAADPKETIEMLSSLLAKK